MANELTLEGTLQYKDSSGTEDHMQILDAFYDLTSNVYVHLKQTIATSEQVIVLGTITTLGWAFFINRDTTNFVEIRSGTGGTKIIKIPAGKFAFFFWGSGLTAPYIISDTASCKVEYWIGNAT